LDAKRLALTANEQQATGAGRGPLRRTWAKAAIAALSVAILHVCAYLLVYQVVHMALDKPAYPPLGSILRAATGDAATQMGKHFPVTLQRWALLFVAGCIVGIGSGVLIGYSRRLHRWFFPDVDFLRSLPATAMTFFVLAAFGDGYIARNIPAFYITVFTVMFLVVRHTKKLKRTRENHLRDLGATRWFIIFHCVLYELLSPIMIGVRQAISLSFLVFVSVELIVGPLGNEGLGKIIYEWEQRTDYACLLVVLAFLGVWGYGLNVLVEYAHRLLVPWEREH